MVSITINSLSVDLATNPGHRPPSPKGQPIVQDVSATLNAGELTGIIGPNGAGKSTLVRAMLGLVPASGGSILIDGEDITRLPPRRIAQTIAYLPQGQTLHWPLSVERLVALGRLPHLSPMSRISQADEETIADAMRRANVTHLQGRIATELSGGERARVLLARALAVGAKGLVADEPLASLDPGHQIDVMELLAREAHQGALVAAVLHDLGMAARYCDRLLLIDGGRLVADGTPAQVLTPEILQAVYGIRARIEMQGNVPTVLLIDRVREERK